MKRKQPYTKPRITKELVKVNSFFDSRYIDSLPSLFDNFEVLAQSGCGGGSCTSGSCTCACLLPDTRIHLADLSMSLIQDIKPDMFIYDGTVTGAQIIAIYPHVRFDGYINVNNGLIKASDDHEFWIINKNAWTKAKNIAINDLLLDLNNSPVLVANIKHIYRKELVYNIELEIGHTFYFANGIKTHMMKLYPSTNHLFLS